MLRKHYQPILEWLRHVITEPREELNRWQTAVRFSYELAVHGWRTLQQDNAPQMAAALAYRTLFALLPVLVVATVVLKGLRGVEQFRELAHSVVDALGLRDIEIRPAAVDGGAADVETETVVSLQNFVDDVVNQLAHVNLQALGWVGFAIVIYSAITMMVTIENSFNTIYRAPQGRAWVRRVTTYWFVLTVGPLAIGLMMYVNAQFDLWIHSVQAGQWLIQTAAVVWSFGVTWLFMFLVYWLVPNTQVSVKATLVGAFVAAVLVEIGRHTLGAYFSQAFAFSFLYGTLGLIPVLMFWIYLMWLVVLFGLEVSFTIQAVHGRRIEDLEEKRTPVRTLIDPASVVTVMEVVSEQFASGKPASTREIADQTLLPESAIRQMVDELVDEGLVHRLDGAAAGVVLARPPEQISADSLIEIGYRLTDEPGMGRKSVLIERLRNAQRNLAKHVTLASALAAPETTSQVPVP